MAHVASVPKREPCQKCGHSVFLAERLNVGKKIYHRTCLKCARCNSQLTPGSFYETEIDNEYCCETCPDEEANNPNEDDEEETVTFRSSNVSTSDEKHDSKYHEYTNINASPRPRSQIRSSIANRLAFFEQSQNTGHQLLQKSLSDEEKSKTLKRMSESTEVSQSKTSIAFNKFLDQYNDPVEEAKSLPVKTIASEMETSESTSTSSETEVINKNLDLLANQGKSQATAEKQYDNDNNNDLKNDNNDFDTDMNSYIKEILRKPDDEDSNFVTKDNCELDVQMRTKIADSAERNLEDKEVKENEDKKTYNILLDEETTNRLSVVRARLHQFEVIASNITEQNNSKISINRNNSIKTNKNENSIKEDRVIIQKNEEVSPNTNNNLMIENKTIHKVPGECDQHNIDDEVLSSKDKQTSENSASLNDESINESKNNKNNIEQENVNNKQGIINSAYEITGASNKVGETQINTSISQSDNTKTVEIVKSKDSSPSKTKIDEYPEDLNPFKSDDDENENEQIISGENIPVSQLRISSTPKKYRVNIEDDRRKSLNPFDSSDDEIEMAKKVKPPRPPPPKINKNPFDSESDGAEDDDNSCTDMSNTPLTKKPPVPTPRNNLSLSQNSTPEPTPRLSAKTTYSGSTSQQSLANDSEEYLGSSLNTPDISLQRNSNSRGSINSITSSTGTIRSRKSRKAPAPPPPVKELFPSTKSNESKSSTPSSSSNSPTPSQNRKKRPAPAPPKPARLLDSNLFPKIDINSKNLNSYPLQSDLEKLSDEEKVLLEGKQLSQLHLNDDIDNLSSSGGTKRPNPALDIPSGPRVLQTRRLIPLDFSIVEDAGKSDDTKHKEEENVVYRRTIIPHQLETPTREQHHVIDHIASHDGQLEKQKDNKEANNRIRQSQMLSSGAEDIDPVFNKSSQGKWKRRKGPAPKLPVPPRKILQMLPLQEIRHELDIIEVQQQGLEKQGVILEKMIRDRCEGVNGEPLCSNSLNGTNTKEVEDLILQLFELVNEKNELFRRQAELMYIRRQHRLEQEQADIEYEIRVLMAQPERNKTDSDKGREEALIARLVEVVQLRNDVIECLEKDRLREAEEDLSIKQRLELHAANREKELSPSTPTKLSKKEKKKQKETKRLEKSKQIDVDKDADESEVHFEKKIKKKRKKFLF